MIAKKVKQYFKIITKNKGLCLTDKEKRKLSLICVPISERLHQPAERRHSSVPSQHDWAQLWENLLLQHDEDQPGHHERRSDRTDGGHLHRKQWVSASFFLFLFVVCISACFLKLKSCFLIKLHILYFAYYARQVWGLYLQIDFHDFKKLKNYFCLCGSRPFFKASNSQNPWDNLIVIWLFSAC